MRVAQWLTTAHLSFANFSASVSIGEKDGKALRQTLPAQACAFIRSCT